MANVSVFLTSPLIARFTRESELAASVIIATRSTESYLDITLRALKLQRINWKNCEVVIADASSDDGAQDVISQYQRASMNIQVIRFSSASGHYHLLNDAAAIAKGCVLIFLGDRQITRPDFIVNHLVQHTDSHLTTVASPVHGFVNTHVLPASTEYMRGVSPNAIPLIKGQGTSITELWNRSDAEYHTPMLTSVRKRGAENSIVQLSLDSFSIRRELFGHLGGFRTYMSSSADTEADFLNRLYERKGILKVNRSVSTLVQIGPM